MREATMKESEWEALREHLGYLRPVMDTFCREYFFTPVDPATLGRYPRLRIERGDEVKIWFDLWMGLDQDGRYYATFRTDLPYELSAGAYIETEEGAERVRYQHSLVCLDGLPFSQVVDKAGPAMREALPLMAAVDRTWLLAHGKRVVLS